MTTWNRFVAWLQARWIALWTPPASQHIVVKDELDADIWLYEEGFDP